MRCAHIIEESHELRSAQKEVNNAPPVITARGLFGGGSFGRKSTPIPIDSLLSNDCDLNIAMRFVEIDQVGLALFAGKRQADAMGCGHPA